MKKIIKILLTLSYILLFAIIILEICYRVQFIDTYKPELTSFNTKKQLTKKGKTILILGDSFSAGKDTWAGHLQKKLRNHRVINSAVAGTGPIQQAYIAEKRIGTYQPDVIIWQLYAGDDLWDVYKTANWKTVAAKQNIYRTLSNYLRSLSYLNYRIEQQFDHSQQQPSGDMLPFSPERYAREQKDIFLAEPKAIQNQLLLENGREKEFIKMMVDIKDVVEACNPETKIIFLVIPHCAQVNQQYLDNMKPLGATFTDEEMILQNNYTFLNSIQANFRNNDQVTVHSLLEEFKEEENEYEDPVYFQNAPHLNPAGHEVISDFIQRQKTYKELFQ